MNTRVALALLDDSLDETNREILKLRAAGNSISEVARAIHLGKSTVSGRILQVRRAIGARTEVEAIATLVRDGVIE